jgi:hypothetical protein
MSITPQILPWARAGLALAGLAAGVGACAPVPYASYAAPDCRPFQELVTVNGQQQTRYTTQCRMADGSWHVVAQSDGTASAPATQPQSGTATPLASNPQGYAYGTLPYDPGFDLSYAGYPYPYAYPYYYPGYFGPGFAVGFGFNRFAFNWSGFHKFDHDRFDHDRFDHGGFAHGGFDHDRFDHGGFPHGGFAHGGFGHGGFAHGGGGHGGGGGSHH